MTSLAEKRFWNQLLRFIDEGHMVPIIGCELLTIEGDRGPEPLCSYLARRLAEYLDVETEEVEGMASLNAVACRYKAGNPQLIEEVYSALLEVMPAEDQLPIPEPLRKLAEIEPLKLFVSTTFDPLLERALNEVRFDGERRTRVLAYSPNDPADLPCELSQLARPTVFHLLGRMSAVPSSYAITQEDTLEFVHALQSDVRRPALLFDELKRQQLLILGSSFHDWLARFFIRAARGERLSKAVGYNFVAGSWVRDDPELRQFLTDFSALTKVYEGGAVELIDQLHARWVDRRPEPNAAPPPTAKMAPGTVFLSYASDDQDTVRAIKGELEKEVDVWFDKDALSAGDRFETAIKRNIENSSFFLPIITRKTLTSDPRFFRLEWRHAEDWSRRFPDTRKWLIPVITGGVSPADEAIPEHFRNELHMHRIRGERGSPEFAQDLGALVDEVTRLYRLQQKARVA